MIDFVPIELYTPIYYYVILCVILFTLMHTRAVSLDSSFNLSYLKRAGLFTFLFVLLYMGLRPINGVFVDMTTYNNIFVRYSTGGDINSNKDLFFHIFTKFLSKIINAKTYFFICACLYVIPLFIVCKKWFQNYWFYGFLFLISAFSFWAYGTNGIRNGIAGSLFLLAVSREKRIWQILWLILAINFHKTMLLPTLGFLLANFYNQPKKMMIFWILCIPLSLLGGGYFETFFSTIGIDDERLSYLTEVVSSDKFSNTGFRWDFLLYSSTGVFAGWYYIVKVKYKDKIYFWLFNTYLFANAFWILVIRANFSNRFAYLSWFMIGLVIIYPLLRMKIISNQHKHIGIILIAYFAFTFLMNIILK
jgi:hypothetical protein